MLKKNMKKALRPSFFQKGAANIEYALVAALIAIVAINGVGATGSAVNAMWDDRAAKIAAAVSSALGL